MQYAIQKMENGELISEKLSYVNKHGVKGKVLFVASKENAEKILSENEEVWLKPGMQTVSFRGLTRDLKPLAIDGDVYCLLAINSPDGRYKIKEKRFGYPNQIAREYAGLTTIAYVKQGKILDQLIFSQNGSAMSAKDEKIGFKSGSGGDIEVVKWDKSVKNSQITFEF